MILKSGGFSDFAKRVKETEAKVVVYGAGVIGRVVAPYWLQQYQLDSEALCYVDADTHKQGQTVSLSALQIPIRPPAALGEESQRYIILITVSAFESVVQTLEQLPLPEDTEVYFLPIMLIDAAHRPKNGHVIKTSEKQLIPKKIHYCWFSGNPIPDKLQKCIDSWRRFCPDYEIICWDESNFDVNKYLYTRQAYESQRWSFISDVARLDILFRDGGIYLDTDVELLRNLDELLFQPAFCATEKWGVANSGGCSGAQAGNPFIEEMLNSRKNIPFLHENGMPNLMSSGYYETLPLIKNGYRINGETQLIAGGQLVVYASDFFHPFDYISGETHITENTFSIHYFSGTWLGEAAAAARTQTMLYYQEFLSKLKD
mgnify:FL=1